MRQVTLRKDKHVFIWRWRGATESDVIADLVEKAESPDHPMDWFDAAVLAYQVGRMVQPEGRCAP